MGEDPAKGDTHLERDEINNSFIGAAALRENSLDGENKGKIEFAKLEPVCISEGNDETAEEVATVSPAHFEFGAFDKVRLP